MVRLQAEKAFNYAGRDLAAGEEFEATDGDAFVLTGAEPPLARKFAAAEAALAPAAKAAEDSDLLGASEPAKRRGRYGRRDMRAEG